MPESILALDQGTTSSRAILFDRNATAIAVAQQEFPQLLSSPGHVEHDPSTLWESQLATAKQVLAKVDVNDVGGIGITNQRETTILWDKQTGKPIHNAVVWQSRISTPICDRLRSDGIDQVVRDRTGLLLDAYFSATKIMYLLETIDGARQAAEAGDLLFGTVDTFLIWHLTGGKSHITDVSNASRTMLMNIETLEWDQELLRIFEIPESLLPKIVDSSGIVAETDSKIFGKSLPISGIAGDQQAASFGQTCFEVGAVKNTYGTGAFALMNIGNRPVQ